ncbi:MAG: hypothetical protein H8E66_12140 [Planctomycetes bacterium]|nr:hypothetical protein [Planctomycetota bacterium]
MKLFRGIAFATLILDFCLKERNSALRRLIAGLSGSAIATLYCHMLSPSSPVKDRTWTPNSKTEPNRFSSKL